jgi:porphobilinogen synthase
VNELAALGVPAVILFGVPEAKDPQGSGAWDPDGIVQLAIADVRAEVGSEMVLMADLCLDEYTDHGHCGQLSSTGEVDNDATLELYARVAVAQAGAGVDVCAPSGMMDGQVAAIRTALDAHGATDVAILAYAAKYASALYGPFRDAVDVTISDTSGATGDRCGYQQDWRNAREALVELRADVSEGADMVMVKPAMAYLDVVAATRAEVAVPVAAYHVSGEYSMVMAAGQRGWLDTDAVALEHVGAIRRAGADFVLTYFARRLAELMAGAS